MQLHDINPAWAPDGGRLAFASNRDGDREILVMRTDGGGLTQLTINATHDVHPAWSPDGRRLAFASDRDGDREIFVMNADGSDQTQTDGQLQRAKYIRPGRRLTIVPTGCRTGGASPSRRIATETGTIYVIQADVSGLTQLTHNSYEDASPVWRPAPT